MEQQARGHQSRLEEIQTQADIQESQALYQTFQSHIFWVDALNATVRPVIAYGFFGLYAALKIMHLHAGLPWLVWNEDDQAIFAGIISFYFGQRAFFKLRGGR
ncbi:MAG: hypothetical protein EB060_03660 [Proteobacteria bacterium]|nr:hypothetical protein [Pseudomonadota bacterium]